MDDFLECVRSRQQPNCHADLGYKVMVTVELSARSYRNGKVYYFDAEREQVVEKAWRSNIFTMMTDLLCHALLEGDCWRWMYGPLIHSVERLGKNAVGSTSALLYEERIEGD